MESTTNYGLIKPNKNDYFNIDDFNGNADVIDQELKSQSDKLSVVSATQVNDGSRIDTISSKQTSDSSRIEVLEKNIQNSNWLINSNFKVSEIVNQRGASIYTNAMTADMWKMIINSTEIGATTNLSEEYASISIANNNDSGAYFALGQYIENYHFFSNKTVTLSFEIECATAGMPIMIAFSGLNKTYVTTTTGGRQKITYTTTLGTLTSYLLPFIRLSGKVGYTVKLINAKLEIGEMATTFIDDDPATKLAKCQRYLSSIPKETNLRLSIYNNSEIYFNIGLPTSMRTNPVFVSTPVESNNFNVTTIVNGVHTGFVLTVVSHYNANLLFAAVKMSHGLSDATFKTSTNILLSAEL